MSKPLLICLHGASEAGKDEFAKGLIKHGVMPYAFGDKLKEFAYAVNPLVGVCWYSLPFDLQQKLVQHFQAVGQVSYHYLQELVDGLGWEEAKKLPAVREILQRVGTEAGQVVLGQKVWAKLVKKQIEAFEDNAPLSDLTHKVVKDMRFPHEFEVMQKIKGCEFYSILIERRDSQKHMTEENRKHISEQHKLPYHYKVINDCDVEHLHNLAFSLLNIIKSNPKPELTEQ